MSINAIGPRYDAFNPIDTSRVKENQHPADNQDVFEWAVQKNDKMSEFLGEEVSHLDFLLIFFQLLKMSIKDRETYLLSRREERKLQTSHMLKVAENYQSQGAWLKAAGITSGISNLLSAACPVLSYTVGKETLGFVSNLTSRFKGMEPDVFFRWIGKTLHSTAKFNDATSQIHNAYSEGDKVKDQHYADIHRSDYDQRTEDIRLILQHFREIEETLSSILRTDYDTAVASFRSLS